MHVQLSFRYSFPSLSVAHAMPRGGITFISAQNLAICAVPQARPLIETSIKYHTI